MASAPGDSDSSGGAVDEEFAGCRASWKIHAGETDLIASFFLKGIQQKPVDAK